MLRTAGHKKAFLLQRMCWEMSSAAGCCLSLREGGCWYFCFRTHLMTSLLFDNPCGMDLVYSNLEDSTAADLGF